VRQLLHGYGSGRQRLHELAVSTGSVTNRQAQERIIPNTTELKNGLLPKSYIV